MERDGYQYGTAGGSLCLIVLHIYKSVVGSGFEKRRDPYERRHSPLMRQKNNNAAWLRQLKSKMGAPLG